MSNEMSREERLAEQLRANLRKRKSQARAKASRESQNLSKPADES